MKTFLQLFLVLSFTLPFVGCSDVAMVNNKRDEVFYTKNTNSAADFDKTETKIADLKLLETADEYPMRIALFDNNKFYYQIDRLGNGTGTWKYSNGALELRAPRKFFIMELFLSAAKPEGPDMTFKFVDRFGINTIETWVRDPELVKQNKQKVEALRAFTPSTKDL